MGSSPNHRIDAQASCRYLSSKQNTRGFSPAPTRAGLGAGLSDFSWLRAPGGVCVCVCVCVFLCDALVKDLASWSGLLAASGASS